MSWVVYVWGERGEEEVIVEMEKNRFLNAAIVK